MQFYRFMTAHRFLGELTPLRAYRTEFMGTGLLERLDATSLLRPRIRVRYPDAIARRFWLESHEHVSCQLKLPTEPDGPRWDAAADLSNAFFRWENSWAYGPSLHPLDDPEPGFVGFVQQPKDFVFERWSDRRVDVSSDVYDTLFDNCNIEDYYSSWQVLFAAEVADAGIHIRLNLADEAIFRNANQALGKGRIPEGVSHSLNFLPIHAGRDFAEHEKALDAVVWFAEECWRVLSEIIKGHGSGRYQLKPSESAIYEQACQDLARASVNRFRIVDDDLVALIRFLAKYWSNWDRDGRPLIADAYKEFLGKSVLLTRRVTDLDFAQLRDQVGKVDGRFKPILDVIWPNWADEEKNRTRLTLKGAMTSDKPGGHAVADADIEGFVNFLATEGLEAFFWRLNSFENHALRGNEFAVEGMRSDIQGMAIAVEHVAVALGGTETQLYEKFKQLWRDADVLRILKRGDVAPLARTTQLADGWPLLKVKIYALRDEPGGKLEADLVMAHRIRGSVHTALAEDDPLELESLFIGLMRAALLTYVEVRGNDPAPVMYVVDTPVH